MWISIVSFLASSIAAHSIDTSLETRNTLLAKRALCDRDIKCILNAEVMEGPFYVAEPLVRSDIVEDRAGVPLELTIQVLDVRACEPAADLWVDIWHADALGVYSGWASDENLVSLSSFPSPNDWSIEAQETTELANSFTDALGLVKRGIPVEASRWLRGVQRADKEGRVTFKTIVPGWYHGRCDHIHVRIHSQNASVQDGHLMGGTVSHTGQLFFEDDLVEQLRDAQSGMPPYNLRTDVPRKNMEDGLYRDVRGEEQLVQIARMSSSLADGFKGDIIIGVDPSTVQPPSRMPGAPGGGPPAHHGPPGRDGRHRGLIAVLCLAGIASLGAGTWYYRKRMQENRRIQLL